MKTALRIPSQLFLTAGKAIEDALREATFDEFLEHDLRNPIATWEDGKVVFIYSGEALEQMLAQFPETSSGSAIMERSMPIEREKFLELVFEHALQIYIKDDKLHIEFSREKQETGDFLAKPENAGILRNVCRNITGREMEARLIIVEDQPHDRELSVTRRRLEVLMRHIDIVRLERAWSLASRHEAILTRRYMRQMEGSSPDSLQLPRTLPAEGDDLTSQKGE